MADGQLDPLQGICKPVAAAVHGDARENPAWAEALIEYAKRLVAFKTIRYEWEAQVQAWEKREPERRKERLEYVKRQFKGTRTRRRLLGLPSVKEERERRNFVHARQAVMPPKGCVMTTASKEETKLCHQSRLIDLGGANPAIHRVELALPEELVNPPVEPTFQGEFGPDPLDASHAPQSQDAARVRLAMVESWYFPDNSILARAIDSVDERSSEWLELFTLQGIWSPRLKCMPNRLDRFFADDAVDVAVKDESRRWFRLATGREFVAPEEPPHNSTKTAEGASSNDERDAWLYDKDCAGIAASEIEREFKIMAKQKRWSRLTGWRSIRAATKRYANRKNLPCPPSRQQKQWSAR